MQNLISQSKLLTQLNFKGCRFIKINGYCSKGTGEVANVLVNIGVNYGRAKQRDILALAKFAPTNDLEIKAKSELENSLINPDKVRSEAQINAYADLFPENPGKVRFCPNTGEISIFAHLVKKEIIEVGEYKTTKSRELTLAKNKIKKELNFATEKFRNYIVANIDQVKVNGNTIEIQI